MHSRFVAILGCFAVASEVLAEDCIHVSIGLVPPDGASATINPSFAGFGIESSNLFSVTGMEQPNDLTFNLINNLANYTGKPPHIRLGGNTGGLYGIP